MVAAGVPETAVSATGVAVALVATAIYHEVAEPTSVHPRVTELEVLEVTARSKTCMQEGMESIMKSSIKQLQ